MITWKNRYGSLFIYISGSIHLIVKWQNVIAFQSWKDKEYFKIEFTFSNGSELLSEYDDQRKWEIILAAINSFIEGQAQ